MEMEKLANLLYLQGILANVNEMPSKGELKDMRLKKYYPRGEEKHALNLEITSERAYFRGKEKVGYATRQAADNYWKSLYDSPKMREGRQITHQQSDLLVENLKRISDAVF